MEYVKRTTEPSTSNKYYKHTSAGGVNSCIEISNGSVLHNCVGYAWGRAYELMGSEPKLSRGNAEDWYGYSDGYTRSKTPKVGAIICWKKGSTGNGSDGYGHVAVVEEVYSDGSILISQSGYSAKKFWTEKLDNDYKQWSDYDFQGFIYLPVEFEETTTTDKATTVNGIVKGDVVSEWQGIMNSVYKAGLTVDGSFGPASQTAANKYYLSYKSSSVTKNNYVKWLQEQLNESGISVDVDSSFGPATQTAVKSFQKANSLTQDGSVGKSTVSKLFLK